MGRTRKDYTGQRFGSLIAVKQLNTTGKAIWEFQCGICKKSITKRMDGVIRSLVRNKSGVSCGCINSPSKYKSSHPIYRTWINMLHRCNSPVDISYQYYGARGIKVCSRWRESFDTFVTDMYSSYKKGLTLDRIENEKNYSPENCRWITPKKQNRNKRNNIRLNFPKYGMVTLIEAAERAGIAYGTVKGRYYSGWPPERLLEPPK